MPEVAHTVRSYLVYRCSDGEPMLVVECLDESGRLLDIYLLVQEA